MWMQQVSGESQSTNFSPSMILAQSRCELQSLAAALKDFHRGFAHSQERDNMLHVLGTLSTAPLGGQ